MCSDRSHEAWTKLLVALTVGPNLAQLGSLALRPATYIRRRMENLDTEEGSPAERMYERLGWAKAGVIPAFAYSPDGRLRPSTFFYKLLD